VVRVDERLVTSSVSGKVLDVQSQRLIRVLVEVDQPDLVANFGRGRRRVRRREPEIALEGVKHGATFHNAARKGMGYKVYPGEGGVGCLYRQRRRDLLGRERQHVSDRNIFCQDLLQASRDAIARRIIGRDAEIVGRAADRVKHRLT